jgi:hypothetical protein
VRHDVTEIRRRARAIRRLLRLEATPPEIPPAAPPSADTHSALWQSVSTPVRLRTALSPPLKDIATLGLLTEEDLHLPGEFPTTQVIQTCFKGMRKAIRHLLKYARSVRRFKYYKFLLRLFAKKPNLALKSILRTAAGKSSTNTLPTDLSILKDESSGLLITNPKEVVTKLEELETRALSPDPTLPLGAPFPWLEDVKASPTSSIPMIAGKITPAIMLEALRRTPKHKAAGPYGVPCLVLKHMPPAFHEALHLLFQALAETGITPPAWLQSHTILLYKKGDSTLLDNYRPITLANAIYKLWTTCIVILATEYIESRKIISPEQEGFRADMFCARAVTHLSLCVEDAHTSKKDIILCYLDFKGAFPSTDHKQLVRTLEFLGLPRDFTFLVSNLYSGASTQFITPHGHTSPVGIGRGTLQGDPLSPLLFDLMVEPLIRWLNASEKGYLITSCGLKLASKWYADDGTLVTNSVDDMRALLSIVQ